MADSTPFGMTGMPGSNPGGSQISVPAPGNSNTPAIGGSNNPFLPSFPSGTNTPPITSSINQANPTNATSTLGGSNVASLLGFGNGTSNPLHDITKALHKAGFSAGIAGELANFLQSGAGFNPAVAQALIAAMQPQINEQMATLEEQFGGMGLRAGSPMGVALGDFMGQVNLNEGQIFANLYEQSVQNYLNVLLAGKGPAPQSGFQNLMQFMQVAGQNAKEGAAIAGGGG